MRHMWVDVLKTPARWDAFAKQLKSANAKRRALQEEIARSRARLESTVGTLISHEPRRARFNELAGGQPGVAHVSPGHWLAESLSHCHGASGSESSNRRHAAELASSQ